MRSQTELSGLSNNARSEALPLQLQRHQVRPRRQRRRRRHHPDDAAGVYLAHGNREWFDGSSLIAAWHWSGNPYIVSNQELAEAATT